MGAFWSKCHRPDQPGADTRAGLLTPEEVTARINKIKQWAESKRLMPGSTDPIILSDLVSPARTTDDPTILQWVNLVMAGGGMLGIAHVGFVRVLETAGVRFIGLGGASAGAINAALVAAVRKTPDDISWDTTQEILGSADFAEFEDGSPYWVIFRNMFADKTLGLWNYLLSLLKNHRTVKAAIDSLGAHKGQKFQTWIREHMLEKGGVSTTRQLLDRMKLQEKGVTLWKLDTADWVYTAADMAKVEPWANRDKEAGRHHYPLRLVASEVSTQSLVVFPRDADLFYEDEDRAPPADFVRASMSVPGFFQPLSIPYPDPEDPKSNKQCGAVLEGGSQSKIWQARNQYKGIVPQKAVFTDGGTLSNFPVHLFVEDQPKNGGMPLCPTIGVRFGQDRQNLPAIKGLGAFLNGVVETSKNLLDRQFLFRNAAHADWIAPIDTSTFDWLAFNMPPAEQQRLLLAGMEAAQTFLMSKTKHVPKGVPGRTPWSMDEQGGAAAGTTGAALPADAAAAAGSGLAPDAATTEAAAAVMNGDKLSQWETYKIVNQLLDAASKARSDEFVPVARAVLLQNLKLEQRNKDAKACMDEISKAANELGSGWPVAIFMPGYDVDKLEKILNMRRELQTFWRDVQRAYLPVKGQLQVITDNWWSNNWIGRGQKYRLLMEPLDICNWYYGGNHKPKGRPVCHYIDVTDDSGNDRPIGVSLGEEMAVDNNRRPGRYLMLQRVEMLPEARKAFGIERMESSLGLARELKEKVGSMDWAEYVKTVVTAA